MSGQVSDISGLSQVRATFASPDQMQDAVGKLSLSGFDRADLTVPTQVPVTDGPSIEASSAPASTSDDAQQMRTLGASTAATVAALAAVGVTVATGGAAIPAVVAAVAAGGVAGGSVFALQGATDIAEQRSREERAASGTLILTVRTPTAEKRADAEAILKAAGATEIEVVAPSTAHY